MGIDGIDINEYIEQNKKLSTEVEVLKENRDKYWAGIEELNNLMFERELSIKGVTSMNNIVTVLALNGYTVKVSADSYQRQKEDAEETHFTISYIHPEYENLRFFVTED